MVAHTPLSRTRFALVASVLGVAVAIFGHPGSAAAHISPIGCNANNLVLNFSKDMTVVRPGNTIHYTVSVSNDPTGPSPTPCDVTNATVTLTLPALNGTATGTVVTLAAGVSFPASGAGDTTYPVQSYVVNVNSNVTHITATAKVVDELHDATIDDTFSLSKDLGDTVTQPHTTLTESASPPNGRTPLAVTYTYNETNDGTNAPISGVTVSGSVCGAATYQSGDTNTNTILDVGETWVFTCMHTFNVAGTFVDNATATGTDTVDTLAAPAELAQASVLARTPHTTLTESANPPGGPPPLAVTFTYTELNDGTDPINLVSVSGDICGAATYQSGDTNSNGILNVGETWVFTCVHTFNANGTFTDHGSATGTDTADSLAAPAESAQAVVVVSSPQPSQAVGGITDIEIGGARAVLAPASDRNATRSHDLVTVLGVGGITILLLVAAGAWYVRRHPTRSI